MLLWISFGKPEEDGFLCSFFYSVFPPTIFAWTRVKTHFPLVSPFVNFYSVIIYCFFVVFIMPKIEHNKVTSAKICHLNEKPLGRSSTYIININGASIEPWVTPSLMSAQRKAWTLSTQVLTYKKRAFGFRNLRPPSHKRLIKGYFLL